MNMYGEMVLLQLNVTLHIQDFGFKKYCINGIVLPKICKWY
jgi:hypothetical protein